jgi:dihydrofolate reductase/thymidylate synthase
MYFNLIVACDNKFGIGLNNSVPWKIKEDMKYFKEITSKVPEDSYFNYINAVVMGRKTWDSIPEKFKPLPNRLNIILTNQNPESISHHDHELVRIISNFDEIHQNILFQSITQSITQSQTENLSENLGENTVKQLKIYDIFVIGGGAIYDLALKSPYCRKIYLTEIYHNFNCDTFLPKFPIITHKKTIKQSKYLEHPHLNSLGLNGDVNILILDEKDSIMADNENAFCLTSVSDIKTDNLVDINININYRFLVYQHPRRVLDFKPWKNLEEEKYLETMENILLNGIDRIDRTLVGSYFLPGICLKYDISNSFPISTTKKIVLRWVFEELKLYLTGKTDTKILQKQGITIWDGNTSREFLDKRGLHDYPEGDMGETYGFNYRHFGANYINCHTEYTSNDGYDQLANVINLLKTDPTSRRIIINLWNPATQHKAALPSCLFYYQFCVDPTKKQLHCIIHLRSSDYFLANNWNTCTGSLLTYMLCNLEEIDLTPGTLTVMVSDAHIYKTHLKQVCQNLLREPYPFPILKINLKNNQKKTDITQFDFKELELIGYKSHPSLKAEMAI